MSIACEEYGVFFRESNGHRSSVIVNLSAGDSAPIAELPALLRVMIALPMPAFGSQMPGENGTYVGIELELVAAMERKAGAVFAARELTQGQMKFYFYVPPGTAATPIVAKVVENFPNIPYRLFQIADPEWTVYFDELYPTRIEFQLLRSQEQQPLAEEAGEDLQVPRPICHWVYFSTTTSRDQFIERVRPKGFKLHVLERREDDTFECPYCVELARNDRADHPYLDELVHWLERQADECGGAYDGFEAEARVEELVNRSLLDK
jgi:hypothetical protein